MEFERHVLLNSMVSRSKSRAPQDVTPPTHGARELLDRICGRKSKGWAVEFIGGQVNDSDDENVRMANLGQSDCISLRDIQFRSGANFDYAVLLLEHIDDQVKSFPVVHTKTFAGREIEGEAEERAGVSAHVVVQLPKAEQFDDGEYRCAIEAAPNLTRQYIELFLSRQLKRDVAGIWEFSVDGRKAGKKLVTKTYKYHPRLELLSDVGRAMGEGVSNSVLSYLEFTKRSVKTNTAQAVEVVHDDLIGDIQIRISAKQGPADPEEKKGWAEQIRRGYEGLGFASKLYYRNVAGDVTGVPVRRDEASAADLLLCPKEVVKVKGEPKRWRAEMCEPLVAEMIRLTEEDRLWQRIK